MTHGIPPRLPPFRQSRPHAAAPVIVQYGATISIGGRLYTVTPTLTPAGPAPIPVPVPAPGEPTVTGVFAADGKTPLAHALPGAPVVILGQHFGMKPGEVVFDPAGRAAVTLWSDTRIEATAPAVGDRVRRQSVAIHLPDAPHFVPAAGEVEIDAPTARR
jgi:hypothetical protein